MTTNSIVTQSIIKLAIFLSLVVIARSKICIHTYTKEMPVKKNGRFEKTSIQATVKVCCEGYTIDTNNKSQCVPICRNDFVLENGTCVPRCDNCKNGECLAPNECKCNDGYIETNDGCTPICDDCKSDLCIGPGKCQCNEGYVSSPEGCVPECSNCKNGFCLKPRECQCKPGYKFKEVHSKSLRNCTEPCKAAPEYVCVKVVEEQSHVNNDSNNSNENNKHPKKPELEGFFRYFGKRIHFTGQVEDIEDEEVY